MNAPQSLAAATQLAEGNGRRRRAILGVLGVFLLAAVVVTAWWLLFGRWEVSTDNAYVGGNVVQVTPQVGGTVVAVLTDDTQLVEQGQALVRLDDADAKVQLSQAEANLADAVRSVRGLYANTAQSSAGVAAREADLQRLRFELVRAQAEEARTEAEYERRQKLAEENFISRENVQNAKLAWDAAVAQRDAADSAVREAQAALAQAHEERRASSALVDNISVENHPRVMAAAARVKEAYLALARTVIPAPVTGYVAKRSVQVGSRISSGTALMSIVPVDDLWVDANFKEGQLRDVRIGQPVSLAADLYGDGVVFHGRVVGLAPGTGSAFSLLPAQNASGNWIKIVQRVPVRISLSKDELRAHPLRIGLSMRATVDTHERSGAVLAAQPGKDGYTTPVFDAQAREADALIARIISENLGRGPRS
ncbi:MAG TPA: efflux RND transporter periplasmic adaptor subunit [Burkholderiales bacterium]|nr:efflux RND transporter periplasmic adaptor subunit [Burkholderiales bacterium]